MYYFSYIDLIQLCFKNNNLRNQVIAGAGDDNSVPPAGLDIDEKIKIQELSGFYQIGIFESVCFYCPSVGRRKFQCGIFGKFLLSQKFYLIKQNLLETIKSILKNINKKLNDCIKKINEVYGIFEPSEMDAAGKILSIAEKAMKKER